MVQKVAARLWVRGWVFPSDDWETLSVHPAVNGYLFRGKDKAPLPLQLLGYGTPLPLLTINLQLYVILVCLNKKKKTASAAMHGPHSLVQIGPGCVDRA